jgi:hypothetical protein
MNLIGIEASFYGHGLDAPLSSPANEKRPRVVLALLGDSGRNQLGPRMPDLIIDNFDY